MLSAVDRVHLRLRETQSAYSNAVCIMERAYAQDGFLRRMRAEWRLWLARRRYLRAKIDADVVDREETTA